MHDYIINNRENIFGQYLYLYHEATISSESTVDFVGISEDGAILLIEVKRCGDSRNRQEVLFQIGKYAMDSLAIKHIIDDEESFLKQLKSKKLKNKKIPGNIISKIRNNINQNCINLVLITEQATDELLTSCFYLSFGNRSQKVSVIELQRVILSDEVYCFIRTFNKQKISSTTRKDKYALSEKLDSIDDDRIKLEIENQVQRWEDMGWRIEPLTISTPEYFTFEWKKGQSIWCYYYILKYKRNNYSDEIHKNSIVVHTRNDWNIETEYKDFLQWFESAKDTYTIKVRNKGKTGNYLLYCINISNYDSTEIDEVFDKLNQVAMIRKNFYLKDKSKNR